MTYTKFDKKELAQIIDNERENGKSNQEIYNELKDKYFLKKNLALCILTQARVELKEKYKFQQNLLLGILGFLLLNKAFVIIELFLLLAKESNFNFVHFLLLIPFFLLASIVQIYSLSGISNYEYHTYRFLAMICIADFFQHMHQYKEALSMAIAFVLTILIAYLCFSLYKNLFPKIDFRNLKKDENGDYILEG